LKITFIWTGISNIFRQRAGKPNHIEVLLMHEISKCRAHEPNFAQHKKGVSHAQYISNITESVSLFLFIRLSQVSLLWFLLKSKARKQKKIRATIVLKNACEICAHCYNSRYNHCIVFFFKFWMIALSFENALLKSHSRLTKETTSHFFETRAS